MTEAQEFILDRLMGEEVIGAGHETGPLALACRAIQAEGSSRRAHARTLGYPSVLRRALYGANAALPGTEDRRKFAVTFFSAVAPRRRAPALDAVRRIRLALWCGSRVHSLVCRADCPWLGWVSEQVRAYLSEGTTARVRHLPASVRCPALATRDCSVGLSLTSPEHRASMALGYALRAVEWHSDRQAISPTACDTAAEYAARTASQAEGVTGAVEFCLALAREVGL